MLIFYEPVVLPFKQTLLFVDLYLNQIHSVMRYFIISFSFIFSLSLTAFAQNSKKEAKEKKKQEQYELIKELVQSGKYEFIGRKANPQSGRQIDLTTRSNFLRISSGKANADMPYFGRAYSGGYSSSDGGVKFDGEMEDFDVQQNDKKRRIIIKFKVKGTGDTYSCTLSISSLESASLSVTSNKKQVISYTGTIRKLQEKE